MARTELPAATAGQATEPPLLAATGLGFAAGGRPILGGIDFSLASGALRVLIGPNGAGKSVLLRLLHGLLPPGDGVVLWRGRPLDRTARRRQAMVFQRPVMLRRSVAANMVHALAAAGVRRRERAARLDEALALADLKPLATRPARVLSGGEQQRVALARALSLRPELLFLDEPTASLDPASTLAIETLVLAAHRAGTTVLMVTHDLGQARRLGGEIVFLDRGGLTAPLPAAEFFAAPPSPAAGAFVEGRLVV